VAQLVKIFPASTSVFLKDVMKAIKKGKVNLSLCLTKHHAMKAFWGVDVYLHAFFDVGTRWR
jgi:hypothetical protein